MGKTSDIRQKEVINITNGKRMGAVIDIEFSTDGHIEAISVPGPFKMVDVFRGGGRGIRIPWKMVKKIGEDVILVELDEMFIGSMDRYR